MCTSLPHTYANVQNMGGLHTSSIEVGLISYCADFEQLAAASFALIVLFTDCPI